MPRHCFVPFCTSNYDSVRKVNNKVISTFQFPKDQRYFQKWERAISRQDMKPNRNSVVCRVHFREEDFVKPVRPTKCPRLNANAVPSIFPDFPEYLNQEVHVQRTDPEVRREQINIRIEEDNERVLQADRILNFENFKNNLNDNFSSNLEVWSKFECADRIVFYMIEQTDDQMGCAITKRVVVNSYMELRVFLGNDEVPFKDLSWALNVKCKLTLWSEFVNILARYKFENIRPSEPRSIIISKAINLLEKVEDTGIEPEMSGKLEILVDQLRLLTLSQPRYKSCTVIASFLIFSVSAIAYEHLRQFLFLPSSRHLRFLSSSMHLSPDSKNMGNDMNYIRFMSEKLSERERYVSLLIDEIYIDKGLQYKANNVAGIAHNQPLETARTVESFMIKSIFGSFKEVVRLIPVLKPTGENLHALTCDVIKLVQSLGFRIIVIITDNNRTNQVMFKIFNDNPNLNYFMNPDYMNEKIFLQYDTVHLFKNFRNNWLNLKSLRKTFNYPEFTTYEVKKASFQDLQDIYKTEKNLQVKKAYKLNFKSVYPNNLERQNVLLVDNIFHYSTIAALEDYHMLQTADFCTIIRRWWNTVNIKSTSKGRAKLDKWCDPFTQTYDFRIQYLEDFLKWLKVWHDSQNNFGKLTFDTYNEAVLTTRTIIDVIKYSLDTLKVKYVLTGKLQTDDLEGRFRLYRSLAGSNYRISYSELVESEKKVRLHNIFSHRYEDYAKLVTEFNDNELREYVDITKFTAIFQSEYLALAEVDHSANLYACGYASYAVGKGINCPNCLKIIVKDKGADTEDEYFDCLQRGGLSVPTTEVRILMLHMCAIFQEICRNENYKAQFFLTKNQKGILCSLVVKSIVSDNYFVDFDHTCSCGSSNFSLFSKICYRLANIILNNYTKSVNDRENEKRNASSSRKILNYK